MTYDKYRVVSGKRFLRTAKGRYIKMRKCWGYFDNNKEEKAIWKILDARRRDGEIDVKYEIVWGEDKGKRDRMKFKRNATFPIYYDLALAILTVDKNRLDYFQHRVFEE